MCADRFAKNRAIPLYLMAKAPLPGEVKTRMQPHLGRRQSARLAQLMLEHTVDTACRHWRGEVTLCVWPNPDHPVFTRLAGKHQLAVTTQIDADLGTRMMQALKQGIARSGCSAVMGCDVPHCPAEILAEAHAMLVRGENPVGPAEDGGFYLIGLHRADESLFRGVNWGGGAELEQVRERAQCAGLRLAELPPLRDIDHYPDLEWLAGIDDAYRRFLPAVSSESRFE